MSEIITLTVVTINNNVITATPTNFVVENMASVRPNLNPVVGGSTATVPATSGVTGGVIKQNIQIPGTVQFRYLEIVGSTAHWNKYTVMEDQTIIARLSSYISVNSQT